MKKCWALGSLLLLLTSCGIIRNEPNEKPVIYLYPEEAVEVTVELDYRGELTCTYPAYDGKWRVLAEPDGTLRDLRGGGTYPYLFWEGRGPFKADFSRGFVVKGEDTAKFLEGVLRKMGLLEKEYREFIVYWLPRMEKNPYNLIAFQKENYEKAAALQVTPKPDTVLRVSMAFRALDAPIKIPPQTIPSVKREGFTLVEWGGMEVK